MTKQIKIIDIDKDGKVHEHVEEPKQKVKAHSIKLSPSDVEKLIREKQKERS